MRKTWEILNKIEELKESDSKESSVQIGVLEFVLAWKDTLDDLNKKLNEMYDITKDKDKANETIQSAASSMEDILSASDILAWILEIPNKVHKKNLKKLRSRNFGAESFLGGL